jgi:hypothetical protein
LIFPYRIIFLLISFKLLFTLIYILPEEEYLKMTAKPPERYLSGGFGNAVIGG